MRAGLVGRSRPRFQSPCDWNAGGGGRARNQRDTSRPTKDRRVKLSAGWYKTTMATYIALIRKDEGSDYGVDFPDFPGCITAGRTLEEARRMAVEALALHVEGLLKDQEPLPEPSSLDRIMAEKENRDGVAVLVDAPVQELAVRINITLPGELLEEIDRVAKNRSRFLAEAARARLRSAA